MKKIIALIALIILIACAVPPEPVTAPEIKVVIPTEPEYQPPPTAPTYEGEFDVDLKIEAKRFDFLPNEIKVKKGDRIRLTLTSVDVNHTFTMPAYDIDEELLVGEDVEIELVADKEGQFTFYCDVPGHKEQGMKGKIIVR